MNWLIVIVAFVLAISLIVFLVIRNRKDKKKFIKQLNHRSADNEKNPAIDGFNDKIY